MRREGIGEEDERIKLKEAKLKELDDVLEDIVEELKAKKEMKQIRVKRSRR